MKVNCRLRPFRVSSLLHHRRKRELILLCLWAAAIPCSALQSGDYHYDINPSDTNTVTITYYTGAGGDLEIPEMIDSLQITRIGDRVFYAQASLTSVVIPDSITSIGYGCFQQCTSLTDITIPDSITIIEDSVFSSCTSLASANLPASVTSIGRGAFAGCGSLTSIFIPNSVTSLEYGAFHLCTNLTAITVGPNNPAYSSMDGVLFNKGQTTLIQYPNGHGERYAVPDGVTTIAEMAFEYCTDLNSITYPNSLITIENRAFGHCTSLSYVIFPDNIIYIAGAAFVNCSSLTSVSIPASVERLGDWPTGFSFGIGAFRACTNLTAISVAPNNPYYSSVGGVVFTKDQTQILEYPAGLYGHYIIPDGVLYIGDGAFSSCKGLTSITIPDSVFQIGANAFWQCTSLSSIHIPDSVWWIGQGAFSNCRGMTCVTLPDSNLWIDDFAFAGCISLTSIAVPASVVDIGDGVFSSSENLTSLYFLGNAPKVGSYLFYDDYNATVYYMPNTTGWGVTFGDLPTALWNPQAQDFYSSENEVGFTLTGPPGVDIIVEACEDLMNQAWFPASTNTLIDGSSEFIDYPPADPSSRFYRFRAP